MTPKLHKVHNNKPVSVFSEDTGLIMISGPKLRRALDISSVTLWRWRRDKGMAFPEPTTIKGRLYFPWADVQAWLARQQQSA